MNDSRNASRSIVADYDLPHPPEKVGQALTDPDLVAEWLMPNSGLRPEVGHRFTFQARPVPGWAGVVQCEVLRVEPLLLLSYSWRGGTSDVSGYGHRLDTVVTWTLTPTPNGGTHVLRLPGDGQRLEDQGRGRDRAGPCSDRLSLSNTRGWTGGEVGR